MQKGFLAVLLGILIGCSQQTEFPSEPGQYVRQVSDNSYDVAIIEEGQNSTYFEGALGVESDEDFGIHIPRCPLIVFEKQKAGILSCISCGLYEPTDKCQISNLKDRKEWIEIL